MVDLSKFIELIENECGKKAKINDLPKQKGDVLKTYADISKASKYLNYSPKTKINDGIREFVTWYKNYIKEEL